VSATALVNNGAVMHSSWFVPLAFLLLAVTGCGTVTNLMDPPHGTLFMGAGECYPFGGVVRSGVLTVMGPPFALGMAIDGDTAICQGEYEKGFQQLGNSLYLTFLALEAIPDLPLSVAGDVLTFPLAYARGKEYPWATWWGQKSYWPAAAPTGPDPEGDDKRADAGVQAAE
jgi:hypothetical protein